MDLLVYLDAEDKRVKDYVDNTIMEINAHQCEFKLIYKHDEIERKSICECIKSATNGANQISYWRANLGLAQLGITGKYIIITDKPFVDNWFAHSTANYWFMSVSDWDELYAPPQMDKLIFYEIIQFFAVCAANLSDSQIEQAYTNHLETTVDCIFDFCERKTDIKISMRSGRICPNCETKLLDFGVSEEQFQAINVLLKLMTGKASFNKVFIVHGHGEYKETVARFITDIGLQPMVLSEQPDRGRTIIEKFEKESSKADFAIILYTPDDIGGVVGSAHDTLNPRARQNVIFEHGFFTAKLGRENVVVLLKNSVKKLEIAEDNDGIIYVPYDDNGGWKVRIRNALSLSGYRVN